MIGPDYDSDRIVIELDPGGPVKLASFTDSFASLARYYERHYRADGEAAPKLYVTRVESGSIIAEIAPYTVIMGAMIFTMDSSMVVADFTRRLAHAVRAFADPSAVPVSVDQLSERGGAEERPSADDAKDIQAFVRPLVGKRGAKLGIRHARLEKREGERSLIAEYIFDEADINRTALNIEAELSADSNLTAPPQSSSSSQALRRTEVMLFFEQASQRPGKARGRTADRGVIPEISDKALPIYFLQSLQRLKDQMVKGEVNPFTSSFVVDVMVQSVAGEPRAYVITNVRDILPLD